MFKKLAQFMTKTRYVGLDVIFTPPQVNDQPDYECNLHKEFARQKQAICERNYKELLGQIIPILRKIGLEQEGYLKTDAQLLCEAQEFILGAKEVGALDELNIKIEA